MIDDCDDFFFTFLLQYSSRKVTKHVFKPFPVKSWTLNALGKIGLSLGQKVTN